MPKRRWSFANSSKDEQKIMKDRQKKCGLTGHDWVRPPYSKMEICVDCQKRRRY